MTDINVGQLSEAINGKMDRDASNIASPKLPVFLVDVQYPTSSNGYTWYRKYSDGWVEQGGRTMTQSQTVRFPIAFSHVPNMTWGFCTTRAGASHDGEIFFRSITATQFVSGSRLSDAVSPGFMWHAEGMAAS